MGNNHQVQSQSTSVLFNYDRFCHFDPLHSDKSSNEEQKNSTFSLEDFQCISMGEAGKIDNGFDIVTEGGGIVVTKYYGARSDLEKYISSIIKMSKLLDITLYDELKFYGSEAPYSSSITIQAPGIEPIDARFAQSSSYQKKIHLLHFVASFLGKIHNLYIQPSYIAQTPAHGFYLLNFATTVLHTPSQIFLAYFRWIFSGHENFADCLTSEKIPGNLPIYLQQIYACLHTHKSLKMQNVANELKWIEDKMKFFNNRIDSFYACQYFKKTQRYGSKSEWIYMKLKNEIYFYHIQDQHPFIGRIIRKKKRVDISQSHIAFDHEDLQILYVPDNSKFMVKASEFQFQGSCSISDIEIKYKLPIKFKNCLINRAKNGDIFLLEQNLYRYVPQTNKLVQETKRISDYIFLTSTRDSIALIVKLSIDIFRNGIRVLYKNEQLILAHAGEQKLLEQLSTIRLDIRSVIFCLEVYKGVFVMMASKNIWVFDLNFLCYFSFATPSQLKTLTSFQNEKKEVGRQYNDQLFCVLNQPFKVNFSIQCEGNNAAIKDNFLHILGLIEGQPYYLKYSFLHRIGALNLQGYYPLYVQSNFRIIQPQPDILLTQDYKFNFHEENSHQYKYRTWIFKGKLLVEVYDFNIKFLKNTYEVHLSIEKLGQTLKEHIERLKLAKKTLSKNQQVLLLYKIYLIYQYLFSHSIVHSNISINHICFTEKKELKIHGWSEPPRNWHVSDYKDYLLVCFNVICYNTLEKISDQLLSKFDKELGEYGALGEKIMCAFKQTKTIEKHSQIEKSLLLIRSWLEKELCCVVHSRKTNRFIFSFEYKTPRMTMLNIESQKAKKITIVPEETVGEEFIFAETDQCVWSEEKKKLYIITASHQFYELKINTDTTTEEKLCLEDYECLPQSISSSSFKCMEGDIYSFGGIKKQLDGRSTYCTKIYKFNWKALTWDQICELPEPRINPHLVQSVCGRYIYVIGGGIQPEYPYLKLLKFDTLSQKCQVFVDKSSGNIRSHQNSQAPMKIFHISQQLQLFALWFIEDGDYVVRYVSYSSIGFDTELRVKNYSNENVLPEESVALHQNNVHILRSYGKYTRVSVHKLESLSLKNETIYAI